MELTQINWTEGDRLFFKFRKGEKDRDSLRSSLVKNISLHYSVSKGSSRNSASSSVPLFLSISDVYYNEEEIGFFLDLDEILDFDDLVLTVNSVVVNLRSGVKLIVEMEENYRFADIERDETCLAGFKALESGNRESSEASESFEITLKQENSITMKSTNFGTVNVQSMFPLNQLSFQKPYNLEASSSEELVNIAISRGEYEEWLKLKGDKNWTTLMFVVREACSKLGEIERELKESNAVIREIALKNVSALSNAPSTSFPPPPPADPTCSLHPPNGCGSSQVDSRLALPEKTMRTPVPIKALPSLPLQKDSNLTEVIREMKELFQKVKDVREILTKVPESEIKIALSNKSSVYSLKKA